jgi:hypothetical protein
VPSFEGYFFAWEVLAGVVAKLLEGEEGPLIGDEGESVVGKRIA